MHAGGKGGIQDRVSLKGERLHCHTRSGTYHDDKKHSLQLSGHCTYE